MSDNDFLKLTLDVYEEECQYLKKLEIDIEGKKSIGTFSVPTTCYAVKGRKYHLNAAEVIITYEQIMYATLSHFFINGLHDLKPIPVDYFFPTIVDEKTLISKFNTRYLDALDISWQMLEEARKKNVYHELYQGTLGQPLDLATDSYQGIMAKGVFAPGHAPSSAFDELIRVTCKGGIIIFTLRSDYYENSEFPDKQKSLETSGHWKLLEKKEP